MTIETIGLRHPTKDIVAFRTLIIVVELSMWLRKGPDCMRRSARQNQKAEQQTEYCSQEAQISPIMVVWTHGGTLASFCVVVIHKNQLSAYQDLGTRFKPGLSKAQETWYINANMMCKTSAANMILLAVT